MHMGFIRKHAGIIWPPVHSIPQWPDSFSHSSAPTSTLSSSRDTSKVLSLVFKVCGVRLYLCFQLLPNLYRVLLTHRSPYMPYLFPLWWTVTATPGPNFPSLGIIFPLPLLFGERFALHSYTEPCIHQWDLASWPHGLLIQGWVCDLR